MGSNVSHTDDSQETTIIQEGPMYGEYYCSRCGRKWASLLAWADSYQMCKRCKSRIYPKNLRAVLPGDRLRDSIEPGHPQELCGKCQELGQYCGYKSRIVNPNVPRNDNNECVIL